MPAQPPMYAARAPIAVAVLVAYLAIARPDIPRPLNAAAGRMEGAAPASDGAGRTDQASRWRTAR